MSKTIVDSYVIFYAMGAVGMIGLLSKFISNVTLKGLIKASSDMAKSNHRLMRLVRAKFEHACMVSDKVENIGVFVEKYMHEYQTMGIRLHTWKRLEKQIMWLVGVLALAGMGISYINHGAGEQVISYGIIGAAEIFVLILSNQSADEMYKRNVIKVYMVDYLENVCAHRYAKAYNKVGQDVPIEYKVAVEYEGSKKPQLEKEIPAEMKLQALKVSEEMEKLDMVSSEPTTLQSLKTVMSDVNTEEEVMKKSTILESVTAAIETAEEQSNEKEKIEKKEDINEGTKEIVRQEENQGIIGQEPLASVEQMPRETMIREILEEFLA